MSETLDVLERRWKGACKSIFGQEACGLIECSKWLADFIEPISQNKSSLSGKEVISAPTGYCKGAKWLSFDEVDFNKKFEPLNVNEIKDIDSLVEGISERIYYSGNVVFGKSGYIEKSSNLNDSFYIYGVGRNGNSKYLAYCTIGRMNENCFGCNGIGESTYCIKCSRCFKNLRCFEAWMSQNSSDCYYSSGLESCSECLFSFNMQNKKRCIGNLELGLEKYKKIKGKLLAEMAQKLSKEKKLLSLTEIVKKSRLEKPETGTHDSGRKEMLDKSIIESSFLKTTSIVFGKPLDGGIDTYSKWLTRHTRPTVNCFSAASKKELYRPSAVNYERLPKDRLLSQPEAYGLGRREKLEENDINGLSLENAHEKIGNLAFFNIEWDEGKNRNNIECVMVADATNGYRNSLMIHVKNSGYNFWPRDSDHIFGCDSPFSSQFSIKCHSCTNQIRSFEIDCCGYCSDSYFCHNCENMNNSMFCFNVKNRRNSIGNAELSPPDYQRVKKLLLGQMHDELSSKKDLKYDIYNVACLASAKRL